MNSNGLMKEKKCRHALLKYYSQIFKRKSIYSTISSIKISTDNQLTEEFIQILENILNRSLKGQIKGENTFREIGADSLSSEFTLSEFILIKEFILLHQLFIIIH